MTLLASSVLVVAVCVAYLPASGVAQAPATLQAALASLDTKVCRPRATAWADVGWRRLRVGARVVEALRLRGSRDEARGHERHRLSHDRSPSSSPRSASSVVEQAGWRLVRRETCRKAIQGAQADSLPDHQWSRDDDVGSRASPAARILRQARHLAEESARPAPDEISVRAGAWYRTSARRSASRRAAPAAGHTSRRRSASSARSA
jgi:hypothetical protein